MAQLPPDQQPAFIAQHKGSLLKQLNFQPTQLQLLRNNHIQLQLSRPQVRTLPPTGAVVQGQQTSQQQQNVINDRFLRERGMASTPKVEYQVFLCIFQKNFASYGYHKYSRVLILSWEKV